MTTPRRRRPPTDETFLLIPASEAGRQYGEEAERVLPGVHLVNVPGQADLMFCREQNELTRRGPRPHPARLPDGLRGRGRHAAVVAARPLRHPGLDAARSVSGERGA